MPCWAGETLNNVLARKTVRCGVSPDIPGLALHDAQGQWSGMDVDFCRAVAAAILQTPDKVSFLPLPTRARFSSLLSKEIDLLSRNTSQTIGRESQLGVLFAGPLVITGQAFLVRSEDAGNGLNGLDNANIAVSKVRPMSIILNMWPQKTICDSIRSSLTASSWPPALFSTANAQP